MKQNIGHYYLRLSECRHIFNMQKQLKTAAYSKINPCCVGLWVSDTVSPALLKTHGWQLVPTVQRKPLVDLLVESDIHILKLKCVKCLCNPHYSTEFNAKAVAH